MQEIKASIELTMILIPDEKTGYCTAFLAQFPEAIAQGATDKEAQSNLFQIFNLMLKDRSEEVTNKLEDINYTTKPLNLVSA